jgi:hypothetical protein
MSWMMFLLCFLYKLCTVLLFWMFDVGLLCSKLKTTCISLSFDCWKGIGCRNIYFHIDHINLA